MSAYLAPADMHALTHVSCMHSASIFSLMNALDRRSVPIEAQVFVGDADHAYPALDQDEEPTGSSGRDTKSGTLLVFVPLQ